MSDTSAQTKRALAEEISPYKHLGAQISFQDAGNNYRYLLTYRGKRHCGYFPRTTHRTGAINGIIAGLRTAMYEVGILSRDKHRVGTLGEVLVAAQQNKHPVALKPPPPDDDERGYVIDDGPLCPDAIFTKPTKQSEREKEPPVDTPVNASKTNGHSSNGLSPNPAQPTQAPRRTINKLEHTEVVAATRLFLKHGDVDDESKPIDDRVFIYHDGWSDDRVLREIGADVALGTVANLRRAAFGRLKREFKVLDPETRIIALEAKLSEVLTRLAKAEKVLKDLGA